MLVSLGVTAALIGCGTLPGQESADPSVLKAPETLPGQEAAEACGFPEGTALSFAGRSTTAALNVQEVVGDPMSFDPADIYITRDKFDQGQLHGRLVCAIFVNQPGFVEITVHPEDAGRFFLTPVPSVSAPPTGISREEAVDTARNAVEDGPEWELAVAMSGPLGQIDTSWETNDWSHDLSADLWVWRVFLTRGDRGAEVMIDFVDGTVYHVGHAIVN